MKFIKYYLAQDIKYINNIFSIGTINKSWFCFKKIKIFKIIEIKISFVVMINFFSFKKINFIPNFFTLNIIIINLLKKFLFDFDEIATSQNY